jgi:hypothetical protein
MSEEKSTRDSLASGHYCPATVIVTSQKSDQTGGTSQDGRVVSSSRTADNMNVRITTRPTNVSHSTE